DLEEGSEACVHGVKLGVHAWLATDNSEADQKAEDAHQEWDRRIDQLSHHPPLQSEPLHFPFATVRMLISSDALSAIIVLARLTHRSTHSCPSHLSSSSEM